jgi:Uma2 family endonuclease
MSEPLRGRWTWDAYLAWEANQETRHEFVDGAVRAMTGGTEAHDVIAGNLRMALAEALKGGPCHVRGPDLKVLTGNGNARYPDALVKCGPTDRRAVVVTEPLAVFEVLSRSTA